MRVVLVGALFGATGVGLGAYGAHGLVGQLELANPVVFQTAVEYQLVHAAVLVALGALKDHVLPGLLGAASWLIALGVLAFSGSLYALALGAPADIGIVTPVGGAMMILGWLVLAIAAARRV